MKDSQKKNHPKKVRKNSTKAAKNSAHSQKKTVNQQHNVFQYLSVKLSKVTRQFILVLVIITIVNLILGIIVVYLIGEIEKTTITQNYSQRKVPELPVTLDDSDLNVSADSLLVFEKDSRSVIMEKRSNIRFAPASTTKIMTALIAIEEYDLNEYLTAGGVSSVQGSKMGLYEGEQIRVIDLLYGLMLPSGNDAAHVLAASYPGGKKAFMQKMNQKARELRLYNTVFLDPAGLDDNNYTTAFDLARLAVIALENETFKTVVETQKITVFDKSLAYAHELENLNRLLKTKGVFGVKTGYTEEAGQVLVTSLVSNNKTYIIVVLKSDDRFTDTEEILSKISQKIQFAEF